jgi:acyl carrier protein
MTEDPILARLHALATAIAGPARALRERGPEVRLTEGGFWLNSIELLQLIVACEAEFGVVFEVDQDLTAETLRTLGSLADVVRAKATP